MFVLLLHHMTFYKLSSLHLERQYLWHFMDPCRLVSLVPLAILVVLVVGHLRAEHILPSLVKVVLILNVQDDIVLDLRAGPSLRYLFFINKLDKILDVAIEHHAESVPVYLFFLAALHHLIEIRLASTDRLRAITFLT